MVWQLIHRLLPALLLATLSHSGARAQEALRVAIGQRGGWEQSVCELGQDKGFFKKHGLTLELLYTQGSAETLQSVISNSVDIGIGLGTHALLGAYLKGAPLRGIGASFTSADEQFYYVVADLPVKTMKDAGGKSIAISTNGSASNMFALHLARHFGVDLKPQPAGNYTATLTQVLTRQLDIGFSAAPFNLNYVDEGRIRIIARGSDVPALRDMTSRLHRRQHRGPGAAEGRAEALHGGLSGDARLDVRRSGRDRRLRGMVEAAEADRRAGAGVHDAAEHGAAADLRAGRDHGRRGEVQIHPGAADESAARRRLQVDAVR